MPIVQPQSGAVSEGRESGFQAMSAVIPAKIVKGAPCSAWLEQIDFDQGRIDLQRMAKLQFDVACFGHGDPILENAPSVFR